MKNKETLKSRIFLGQFSIKGKYSIHDKKVHHCMHDSNIYHVQ